MFKFLYFAYTQNKGSCCAIMSQFRGKSAWGKIARADIYNAIFEITKKKVKGAIILF